MASQRTVKTNDVSIWRLFVDILESDSARDRVKGADALFGHLNHALFRTIFVINNKSKCVEIYYVAFGLQKSAMLASREHGNVTGVILTPANEYVCTSLSLTMVFNTYKRW